MKINKHIEIVRSTTTSLSSMSRRSCDAIFSVLSKHYVTVGVSIVNNLSDLKMLVARNPDLVFLGMESIPANPNLGPRNSDTIWLAAYLDEHAIAYTGSGKAALKLGRNKPAAKQRSLDADLKTASFCVIRQRHSLAMLNVDLEFPVFIKPTNRGGGLGIDSDSVAYTSEQLSTKVRSIAHELQADSLIEEYLPGREFSVAILKEERTAEFLVLPIELVAPPDEKGARMLSCSVKSSDAEKASIITDEVLKTKLTTFALKIFYALGARDYGRIDIRLDKYDEPHFMEANFIPSLISGYGSFPKACLLNIGLEYEPMILKITRLGLDRAPDYAEVFPEPALPHVAVPTRLGIAA